MDRKKMLIVLGFILLVLVLGFALYWVFFRTAPTTVTNENFQPGNLTNAGPGNVSTITNTNLNTVLPWQQYIKDKVSPVANGGLTEVNKLTDSTALGLGSAPQGLQYYDADKQQFFRIDENGQVVVLTDKKFYQVKDVTWSNLGDKAIIEYPDGVKILYNFKTNKQVTLPTELQNFSFNTAGSQIVAQWIGDNPDNNWLVTANEDGSGMRLLEALGDKAYSTQMIFSPDSQVAALHTKYIDGERQEVYPIGLNGENFKAFEVAGGGFTAKWSPQGNSMLYSVYNKNSDYMPTLWITKGRTNELGDIKVSLNVTTWPDKCTFADETSVLCAVPQGLPRGAGIYPEIANQYPDVFYRIDLNNGIKTLLASPVGESGSYSAHNLFTSADGSILYFTDINTGRLQSIKLK
ncbi:MAG: hypothetical protein WC465_02730 [Patescibacteria group bacterium]